MLRKHFIAHLGIQKGATAGARGEHSFERDPAKISRLVSVIVNHDGNVDGLKLTYEIYPGPEDLKPRGKGSAIGVRAGHSGPLTMYVQDKVGNGRGDRYDSRVPEFEKDGFSPDETITTIKAMVDETTAKRPILRRLQFITNRGRIFPNVGEYYGKNVGDKLVEITANRVRGIHGSFGGETGQYVHSLGFVYLKLDNTVPGRDYLLAMEPYLFPNQNYGVVTKMAPT
jgi:Jacalin-like lectin domain